MTLQKRKPFKDVEQFYDEVHNHKWSFFFNFDDTSYYSFIKAMDEERALFQRALRIGPEGVTIFFNLQKRALSKYRSTVFNDGYEKGKQALAPIVETGDDEFDEFRKYVVNHDWFYDYTDDGSVWRRGNEQRKKIEGILKQKENDPKYKIFFDHYAAKMNSN